MLQAKLDDWKLVCEPVWLCSLPIKTLELIRRFGIQFERDVDDGLGIVDYAIVAINGHLVLIKSYPEGPEEAQLASVWIMGHETEWDFIIEYLCTLLSIAPDTLPERQIELKPAQWRVVRLDDNGNEVIMFRFPDEWRANQCRALYEKRGHKQAYFVQEEKR